MVLSLERSRGQKAIAGRGKRTAKPTLHLVYSTQWSWTAKRAAAALKCNVGTLQLLPEAVIQAAKKLIVGKPLCCDLTGKYFCGLLAREAAARGFRVVRWPIGGRAQWLALGEAARCGVMAPGAAAVLMHSWHGDYQKECVPAWDFYPVLKAVADQHLLLYPSAPLDKLHSEKRYTSAIMPPTRFLHLVRQPEARGGWVVEGSSAGVAAAVVGAVRGLRTEAAAVGLPLDDVMMKQGLSWGGKAVARLAPKAIPEYLSRKVLPEVPAQADRLTVLVQAKVELVAELRWVVLDGELKGRRWSTYNKVARGRSIITAGMKGEEESRLALAKAGLARDEAAVHRLEESLRSKVEQVFAEAVVDAGGEVPQFLRVDLLIDTQGRAWLGERESWGADLVSGTRQAKLESPPLASRGRGERGGPTKVQVAAAVLDKASRELAGRSPKTAWTARVRGCAGARARAPAVAATKRGAPPAALARKAQRRAR